MKKNNKFFALKIISMFFVMCIVCTYALAEQVIKRDPTITCEGIPKWDRFVVNEKDRKWNAANGGCYMLADDAGAGEVAAKKMYGQYGDDNNFVTKSGTNNHAMYGTYNENVGFEKNRAMYGSFDGNYESSVKKVSAPKPIMAKAASAPVEKNPIKTKPAKSSKQIAVAPKKILKAKPVAVAMAPVVAEPKVAKPVKQQITKPTPVANDIAHANKVLGPDDYCTDINLPVKGDLPAGLVLMSGAPDKMCCVVK